MKKDFLPWHSQKEFLHENKKRAFFHEREVWFCTMGVNIGFEQDGKGGNFLRPVLIVVKFNNETCWALPLTKKQKKGKFYFSLKLPNAVTPSTITLSQIRMIDAKRLQYKIGIITENDFTEIKKNLIKLLE